MIIWLTGLSGAGKSTIAEGLEKSLISRDIIPFMIDGDRLRGELCRDLGFSDSDRKENIRRACAVALMAAQLGMVSICSLISPFRADRDAVRNKCKEHEITFLEVYINAPISVCEERDPKILYQKARAGLIADFTGIDSSYEPPINPELIIPTERLAVAESIDLLKNLVDQFLPASKR
jgi:adenylyl-sulfate kinase